MPLTPITATITWFPGGAQRDANGERVPWPWGDRNISPREFRYEHLGPHGVLTQHCQTIWRSSWPCITGYHDPADLEPPKWE